MMSWQMMLRVIVNCGMSHCCFVRVLLVKLTVLGCRKISGLLGGGGLMGDMEGVRRMIVCKEVAI